MHSIATKKSDRTRNWLFEVYPESAPSNWRDILDANHITWIESPLHEFDTNATGECKKPHWHILLMFDSLKTFDQVKELTEPLNGTIPIKCLSAKGSVRYFAHLDNPEKHQYNRSDIIGHGGADVNDLLKPTSASRYECIKSMIEYVREYDVTEFIDLIDYAMENHYDDWFPLLCDNSAFVMEKVVNSNRYRIREE